VAGVSWVVCAAVGCGACVRRGWSSLAERWNGTEWSIQATPILVGGITAICIRCHVRRLLHAWRWGCGYRGAVAPRVLEWGLNGRSGLFGGIECGAGVLGWVRTGMVMLSATRIRAMCSWAGRVVAAQVPVSVKVHVTAATDVTAVFQ
jgi:hypothetical protein